MEQHTCTCAACNGKAILAPADLIKGSAKQVRELTHSYVSYAHGTSPLSRRLATQAGVKAV